MAGGVRGRNDMDPQQSWADLDDIEDLRQLVDLRDPVNVLKASEDE